jgi:hypothetical protein
MTISPNWESGAKIIKLLDFNVKIVKIGEFGGVDEEYYIILYEDGLFLTFFFHLFAH